MIYQIYCLILLLIGSAVSESLGRRKTVPVLYVQGSHYDVGFDMGRTFRSMIQSFLMEFEDLREFERQYKTERGRSAFEQTLANMKKRFPYYVKEIQGIADGAGVSFTKLFLLHMDDIIETINENSIPRARNDTGGCSDIAFSRPGRTVMGHTEDALAPTLNHFYIVSAHVIPTAEDRAYGAIEEKFASLCYAGQLPGYTMGYNENGLVFTINTLRPKVLRPGNTPRTFMTRALLTARNPAEAENILRDEGLGVANGFSVNMAWTTDDGVSLSNTEVAPNLREDHSLLNKETYTDKPLMHCNKYLRIRIAEDYGPIIDSSISRMAVFKKLQPDPQEREDIEECLSDTQGKPVPIFQEKPDDVVKTIAAGVFDLQERTWSIYIEPPHRAPPVAVLPMRFTNQC